MQQKPFAVVCTRDHTFRALLIDLLHENGFRVQTTVQRDELASLARTLPVSAVVAEAWAFGPILERSEREAIKSLAKAAPLILIGAGPWAQTISAEDLGVV